MKDNTWQTFSCFPADVGVKRKLVNPFFPALLSLFCELRGNIIFIRLSWNLFSHYRSLLTNWLLNIIWNFDKARSTINLVLYCYFYVEKLVHEQVLLRTSYIFQSIKTQHNNKPVKLTIEKFLKLRKLTGGQILFESNIICCAIWWSNFTDRDSYRVSVQILEIKGLYSQSSQTSHHFPFP